RAMNLAILLISLVPADADAGPVEASGSVTATGSLVFLDCRREPRLLHLNCDGQIRVFPVPSGAKVTLSGKPVTLADIGAINLIDRPVGTITIIRSGGLSTVKLDVHLLGRKKG